MPTDFSDLDFGATIRGFAPGQKLFGRYTLRRILGRGGMGVVWLAHDESLEREIAIKMLPEIVANDPTAVRELKRETNRSQRLSHPRILRIYDFVEAGQLCGITMEWVEGGTLAALRADQPGEVFTVAGLQKWVRQACEALDYAHRETHIVHRDLKPANLMVDAKGDLKLADFGIARSIADSMSRVSVQAGTSGTPVYMSPQQMMGEDPAVTDDVYALGATLFELLSGKPPFHSGNVLLQVQSKIAPRLNERRKAFGITGDPVPPEWEATIAACLAKETQDRPQSAGEVAARLGLAAPELKDRSTAKHRSTAEPAPKKKSKRALYAGLAAVIVLAGAGYYFGVYAPEQPRRAELARVEPAAKPAVDEAKEKARLETEAQTRRMAEEKHQAEAAALAAARGGIVVRTEPAGAEVSVGALEQGPSPLRIKEAKLGKYPVKVRLAGYEDWSGEIEVKENQFAELNASLVRSTGTATITSEPSGLDFTLTSKEKTERGLTPTTLTQMPTGAYTLTVRREGWPEETQTVTVARGATASAQAEFAGGNLEITSEPSGAEVYSDGKKVGVTPLSYQDLRPQSYAYELRLKGYKPASVRGEVKAHSTAQASANLTNIAALDAMSSAALDAAIAKLQNSAQPLFVFFKAAAHLPGRVVPLPESYSRVYSILRDHAKLRFTPTYNYSKAQEGIPHSFAGTLENADVYQGEINSALGTIVYFDKKLVPRRVIITLNQVYHFFHAAKVSDWTFVADKVYLDGSSVCTVSAYLVDAESVDTVETAKFRYLYTPTAEQTSMVKNRVGGSDLKIFYKLTVEMPDGSVVTPPPSGLLEIPKGEFYFGNVALGSVLNSLAKITQGVLVASPNGTVAYSDEFRSSIKALSSADFQANGRTILAGIVAFEEEAKSSKP